MFDKIIHDEGIAREQEIPNCLHSKSPGMPKFATWIRFRTSTAMDTELVWTEIYHNHRSRVASYRHGSRDSTTGPCFLSWLQASS